MRSKRLMFGTKEWHKAVDGQHNIYAGLLLSFV